MCWKKLPPLPRPPDLDLSSFPSLSPSRSFKVEVEQSPSVVEFAAAKTRVRRRQRLKRLLTCRESLEGCILWRPDSPRCAPANDDNRDTTAHNCYAAAAAAEESAPFQPQSSSYHPCVVLSREPQPNNMVQVYSMTSFRGRALLSYMDYNTRKHFLPIHPSPRHPDNGCMVELEEEQECQERRTKALRKQSYIDTGVMKWALVTSLRRYQADEETFLKYSSFRNLLRYHGESCSPSFPLSPEAVVSPPSLLSLPPENEDWLRGRDVTTISTLTTAATPSQQQEWWQGDCGGGEAMPPIRYDPWYPDGDWGGREAGQDWWWGCPSVNTITAAATTDDTTSPPPSKTETGLLFLHPHDDDDHHHHHHHHPTGYRHIHFYCHSERSEWIPDLSGQRRCRRRYNNKQIRAAATLCT